MKEQLMKIAMALIAACAVASGQCEEILCSGESEAVGMHVTGDDVDDDGSYLCWGVSLQTEFDLQGSGGAVEYLCMASSDAVALNITGDDVDDDGSYLCWGVGPETLLNPQMHTVTFYRNYKGMIAGKSPLVTSEIADGDCVGTLPSAPQSEGYAFAGWFVDDGNGPSSQTRFDASMPVTGDMVVFAKWTPVQYSITYAETRGVSNPNSASYTIEDEIVFEPLGDVDGYRFVGWSPERIPENTTGDITVTARWEAVAPPVPTYGPWGESEDVANPDKLGPTYLMDMPVTVYDAAVTPGDVVAVYRDDTGALCGLGKALDGSGRVTAVYYAPKGTTLSFKVWLAASGVEEPTILDCDRKCRLTAPDVGGFYEGHALSVSNERELTLNLKNADWHCVSFNVVPEDPSPNAVFAEVADRVTAVTQGVAFWMPGRASSLAAIEVGKGYWVKTSANNVSWTVSGLPDPTAEIPLAAGWNLIGYAPETEGAVGEALETALADGAIDFITCGVEFYPGGTLAKMTPGKAYWVHAKTAYTLVYDEVSNEKPKAKKLLMAKGLGAAPVPTYGPFGESEDVANPDKLGPTFLQDMTLSFDGTAAEYGDCVAVYRGDTGALCGLGKVLDDSGTLTSVCYAPKGVTLHFRAWQAASGMVEPAVFDCTKASDLAAPAVGEFYTGHALEVVTEEQVWMPTFVPGEKTELDTGLVGYTAKGLPAGLKYDAKTGKITGAATKPTGEGGVMVTFTKRGEPNEELTIVVTALPTVSIAMEGESEGDVDGCKVTGAGAYLVGKKVSLSATAPKGTAFLGWYRDGAPWPDEKNCRTAKQSYVMTRDDLALTVRFEKEKMSVDCAAMAGEWIAGVNGGNAVGAENGIPLEITTQSGVKSVKVTNLPAGMKYDSKTGLVTGAPTKTGSYTVKLEVTANSGAVAKKEITVGVVAADSGATGSYNGFVIDDGLYEFNRVGTLSFTAGADGKLSAKVTTAAWTYSFSASFWDCTSDGRYYTTMTTKKGERLDLTVATAEAGVDWSVDQVTGEFRLADGTEYSVSAQKNVFDRPWYFKAEGDERNGWTLVNWNDSKTADLTVTFANGATKLSGKLGTYKLTASGFVNMASFANGVMQADFAVIVTGGKDKRVLDVNVNLGFDRTPNAEAGDAGFVR